MYIPTMDLPGKWITVIGSDGGIHAIPMGEEHDMHYGCICNPVQTIYFAGGSYFTHRMLSC